MIKTNNECTCTCIYVNLETTHKCTCMLNVRTCTTYVISQFEIQALSSIWVQWTRYYLLIHVCPHFQGHAIVYMWIQTALDEALCWDIIAQLSPCHSLKALFHAYRFTCTTDEHVVLPVSSCHTLCMTYWSHILVWYASSPSRCFTLRAHGKPKQPVFFSHSLLSCDFKPTITWSNIIRKRKVRKK